MKKSDLIRIIREELKAITELTQAEKNANVAALDAEIKAKTLALKTVQDKAKQAKAAPIDK
jgi:hypothetical protein